MTVEISTPVVSVVIPCYNQAHFLSESIESALAQTHRRVEVVVVDDGSSDNTVDVVASHPGVRCVRQENRGRSCARNAGFRVSCGEYVVFLDADDRLTPNAIEAHLRCFSEHPAAGFVVGDIDHIASDGSYLYSPRWPVLEGNFYAELLKANHLANTLGVMFRRSLLDVLGGFAVELHAAEDYEILLRAARVIASAHHPTVVAQYRRHLANTSRNGGIMLRAMNRVMLMQWPFVKDDPGLTKAWRQGDRYWRDHFGLATVKQLGRHLRRGELFCAAGAGVALVRYVRGRLFLWPWIFWQRGLDYIKRRVRAPGKPDQRSSNVAITR